MVVFVGNSLQYKIQYNTFGELIQAIQFLQYNNNTNTIFLCKMAETIDQPPILHPNDQDISDNESVGSMEHDNSEQFLALNQNLRMKWAILHGKSKNLF